MNKVEITVYDALIRRKILEDQIDAMTSGNKRFVSTDLLHKIEAKHSDTEMFISRSKSDFESFVSLQSQLTSIVAAITLSNATTKVTIAGKEMTVSEAIAIKNGMPSRRALLNQITRQFNDAETEVERARLKANAEIMAIPSDTPEARYKVRSEDIKFQTLKGLICGFDVKTWIYDEEKFLTEFESEVDSVLNRANVMTVITYNAS